MRISQITIKGFRCFTSEGTTVRLHDLTAMVGVNGSGKTALMTALQKLFGTNANEREIRSEDFHVGSPAPDPLPPEQHLSIEVRLDFPELAAGEVDGPAVPECFRQMQVDVPGGLPFCLVRLSATLDRTSGPDGVVEYKTWWVRPGATPADEVLHELRAVDRARIQTHYVPAARDPLRHVRNTSGSIIARLLKAAEWSETGPGDIEAASSAIQDRFLEEGAVEKLQATLTRRWKSLHSSPSCSEVAIRPVSRTFSEILRHVEAVFAPSPNRGELPLDRLSDGQRSLFYLSLVAAAFDIEEEVLSGATDTFSEERLNLPTLTLLAVEEPETHVSPHYLARIMQVLRQLALTGRSQVLLTSHSASIMHRVEPPEVRHFRLDLESGGTAVSAIVLPADDAHTYVREAVRAHPELYFARAIVFGEGDSEEIVIPRVSSSLGLDIDRSFISFVPLGGRHVNHFWRLVSTLGVPHLTLLDLDREREGGGWGRIKYALTQLLALGVDPAVVLNGTTAESLAVMHERPLDANAIEQWVVHLEQFGVYFSSPLDLDFLMLSHFPDVYKQLEAGERGPTIPGPGDDRAVASRTAVNAAVLKGAAPPPTTYSPAELELFYWYRYLFITKSKPSTHIEALARVGETQLRDNSPPVLCRLTQRLGALVTEE